MPVFLVSLTLAPCCLAISVNEEEWELTKNTEKSGQDNLFGLSCLLFNLDLRLLSEKN